MHSKDAGTLDKRPTLTNCLPDAVHVAKRKRQSFANWWLWVEGTRTNLVLLRDLRNDANLRPTLKKYTKLSSVRNRDRQDVESLLEISSNEVVNSISSVEYTTHTVSGSRAIQKRLVTETDWSGCLHSCCRICR